MEYTDEIIQAAFQIYTKLASQGQILKSESGRYWDDDEVRSLTNAYAQAVQCTIIHDALYLYLIPIAADSPFHMRNDTIKKEYLTAKSVNMDIYLMYLSIIVLFGIFYDSYQSAEPLQFVPLSRWLDEMNQRMDTLQRYDPALLRQVETEQNINWTSLIKKWADMDSIKETVKKQDARTNSRLSFLIMTKNFLIRQQLLHDAGNDELVLTEKAKTIIVTYYMEEEYNRGIMNFMYQLDHKEEINHAVHQ